MLREELKNSSLNITNSLIKGLKKAILITLRSKSKESRLYLLLVYARELSIMHCHQNSKKAERCSIFALK